MSRQWQRNIRNSLKNAKQCNEFFNTQAFQTLNFPIKIPLEYAHLIDADNPNDPLLKQVKPDLSIANKNFSPSPLEDETYSPVPGLIHKYPNRVLLIASRVCAIHCQYCFRQNFDYEHHDAMSNLAQICDYIDADEKIDEVILSGGDPLSLSDEKLTKLINNIEQIPHIKTLRIHTRTAVVVPSRITQQLCDLLENTRLNVVVVLHTNHARELSCDFGQKISELKNTTLLNQSVLLQGVNDSAKVLEDLSKALFDLGILPYYLHQLDKVSGSESFWVSDERAQAIHQKLKQNLSGYLVPKLVRDENRSSKTWI